MARTEVRFYLELYGRIFVYTKKNTQSQSMKLYKLSIVSLMLAVSLTACKNSNNSTAEASTDATKEYYLKMKDQVNSEDGSEFEGSDASTETYDPSSPEASIPLVDEGQVFTLDSNIEVHFDTRTAKELDGNSPMDTIHIGDETFTRDLHNITENDVHNLRHNLEYLKENKSNETTDGDCSGQDCPVYAHINKSEQKMYLYVNGNLLDTFATSTARSGYRTPDFSRKPDGRIYTRYTSHKYHGGDWKGLGNMPYAVFIEGGYAIHGATSGEIRQLGNPASHGCIRIHPKNAKLFNKLVKFAGTENTWVDVTED